MKCFANDKQLTLLEENIKIGSWFYVYGDALIYSFSKELTMLARGIRTYVSERMDTAPEKRVELHYMNESDGCSNIS